MITTIALHDYYKLTRVRTTVWLVVLILGRDVSLGLAAIYYRWASLPAPKTSRRYWDFSLPSASVHPTQISKLNTFIQLGLVGVTTMLPLVTGAATGLELIDRMIEAAGGSQAIFHGLQYVAGATTVWSGASYIFSSTAVRILGNDEQLKKRQGHRGRAVLGISFAGFISLAVWLSTAEPAGTTTHSAKGDVRTKIARA